MGNALSSAPSVADLTQFLHDAPIPNLAYDKLLGKGRFLKTLRCVTDEGALVVKLYVKQAEDEAERVERVATQLQGMRDTLDKHRVPHVLPFRVLVQGERAAYAVRQHLHNNLYDRLSTRPFLSAIEKLWLTFQLVTALERAHFHRIAHGDLKAENVLLTTWDWVYLADFAPYKPHFLREDDPVDFDYAFDSSGRRKCYVAPERFYAGTPPPTLPDDAARFDAAALADLFSLGCVIAELWLEDKFLTYAELIAYKKGQYDPAPVLEKIESVEVRALVSRLIDKRPQHRRATQLDWKQQVFPKYFEPLHDYLGELSALSPDALVQRVARDWPRLLAWFGDEPEPLRTLNPAPSAATSTSATSEDARTHEARGDALDARVHAALAPRDTVVPDTASTRHSSLTALLIDTERARWTLDAARDAVPPSDTPRSPRHNRSDSTRAATIHPERTSAEAQVTSNVYPSAALPLSALGAVASWSVGDVATWLEHAQLGRHSPDVLRARIDGRALLALHSLADLARAGLTADPALLAALHALRHAPLHATSALREGAVLLLTLLTSRQRALASPQSHARYLALLTRVAAHCPDAVLLARVVPYLVALIRGDSGADSTEARESASSSYVAARALGALTAVLTRVRSITSADVPLFSEYVLPVLAPLAAPLPASAGHTSAAHSDTVLVRVALATHLPALAECARRFLELGQFLAEKAARGSEVRAELAALRGQVKDLLEPMLSAESARAVKLALLSDATTLALFFGQERTVDVLLPLLISLLNARDAELKAATLRALVGVCHVAGRDCCDAFVRPCLLPELLDEDDRVVHAAAHALAALADAQLLRRAALIDLVCRAAPLLLHPSAWARAAAVTLVAAASRPLSRADRACFVLPRVRPFTRAEPLDLTDAAGLARVLRAPVSRRSFERALALRCEELEAALSAAPGSASAAASVASPARIVTSTSTRASGSVSASTGGVQSQSRSKSALKSPLRELQQPLADDDDASTDTSDIAFTLRTASLPPAPACLTAAAELSELDVPHEEEQLLFLLRDYIRLVAKARLATPSKRVEAPSLVYARERLSALPLHHAGETDANSAALLASTAAGDGTAPSLLRRLVHDADAARLLALASLPPVAHLLPPPRPNLGRPLYLPASGATLRGWRPRGVLVGELHEHARAVTALCAAHDHAFFVSGARDGSVRVWDSQRLQKNVTNRARLVFAARGGAVHALCACERATSVAVASAAGMLEVVRIDVARKKETLLEYSGAAVLTTLTHAGEDAGAVRDVVHGEQSGAQSLLLYCTQRGLVRAWDLRAKSEAWHVRLDAHLGAPRTLALDDRRTWLACGTSLGALLGLDLRFHVPFTTLSLPGLVPIERVVLAPDAPRSVLVACGPGLLQQWNLEEGKCTRLFRQSPAPSPTPPPTPTRTPSAAAHALPPVTASRPLLRGEALAQLSASALAHARDAYLRDEYRERLPRSPERALVAPPNSGLVVSAGVERLVRVWESAVPERSYVLSGLEETEPQPHYRVQEHAGIEIIEETRAVPLRSGDDVQSARVCMSATQHAAPINAALCLEFPQPLVLTAASDGVIKVWR